MSYLLCENLTKSFRRKKVVDRVDIEIRGGEVVGLLGPNGAGKTTIFYMIVGLLRPNRGKMYLNDEEIASLPMYLRARKGIGYLPQEPSVFRKLTVEENLMAILETLPLSKEERRDRLEDLLDELGLSLLRRQKAYSLSGGERRRVEITRALVLSPSFILLDEPFAGIDPIASREDCSKR
jgi:lipopolysaccharide export system ATP-binding protein